MKRSRTTALLLMSTAPLLFTACERQSEGMQQEGLYTSVENCAAQTGDGATCQQAFDQASRASAEQAPKFASKEECAREYAAEQCVTQQTAGGQSFVGPMMMGFFMAQMLNGNRGAQAAAPAAASPAFRNNSAGWLRPAPGTAGGMTAITSEPNRATTVRRGGFGGAGSQRGSFGG